MSAPTYLVASSEYNPDVGGTIALYRLCDLLNRAGERALIWRHPPGRRERLRRLLRGQWRLRPAPAHFTAPIASSRVLQENLIVVYPEVVSGNPLGARHVTRWLLYRPGALAARAQYGDRDLFFKFDDFCDDPAITGGKAQTLFAFAPDPNYTECHNPDRAGSCYMLRKGSGRVLQHDDPHSIPLDGLSHREIAAVFRRTAVFYCYDEATMFSQFAALSGCLSIVFPHSFPHREAWVTNHPLARFGVAYGLDDVQHARDTRHLVAGHLAALQERSRATVLDFIHTTRAYFGFPERGDCETSS